MVRLLGGRLITLIHFLSLSDFTFCFWGTHKQSIYSPMHFPCTMIGLLKESHCTFNHLYCTIKECSLNVQWKWKVIAMEKCLHSIGIESVMQMQWNWLKMHCSCNENTCIFITFLFQIQPIFIASILISHAMLNPFPLHHYCFFIPFSTHFHYNLYCFPMAFSTYIIPFFIPISSHFLCIILYCFLIPFIPSSCTFTLFSFRSLIIFLTFPFWKLDDLKYSYM